MSNEERIKFVYDCIVQYKLDYDGNSPTRAELVGLVRINKTALHVILRILEARKLLRRDVDRNKAGKIHVVGGCWTPPDNWESPLDAALRLARQKQEKAARLAARKAGLLCECGQGIIRWQKQMTYPNRYVILMCDGCRKYEVGIRGSTGIEPYPPGEEGGSSCPANAEFAAVAAKAKSPTPPAKPPKPPSTPSATNGRPA